MIKKSIMALLILLFFLVVFTPIHAHDVNETDIQGEIDVQTEIIEETGLEENITSEKTYDDLDEMINRMPAQLDVIYLNESYKFNESSDSGYKEGIYISGERTIIGVNNSYIDGNNLASGFYVYGGATLTLENLTFKNCYLKGFNGGGVISLDSSCKLILKNCTFINNGVHNSNGGVINAHEYTSVEIYNCTFTSNTATRDSGVTEKSKGAMGSAVYVWVGSTLTICDSVFTGNTGRLATVLLVSNSEDYGRADSRLYIKNCTFENNTSTESNGVVYLDELGNGEIIDSVFRNNKALLDGGALVLDAPTSAKVTNCIFEKNSGEKSGAIQIKEFEGYTSTVQISGCNFTDNQATMYGGAIYIARNAKTKISNCRFTENSVNNKEADRNRGGAIFAMEGELEVYNSNFNKHSEYNGGAIFVRDEVKFIVKDSNFQDNHAVNLGGAIYIIDSTAEISNSNFTENSAKESGGAVYVTDSKIKVDNSVFTSNTASQRGGAIYSKIKNPTSSNCKYIGNSAPNGPNVYGSYLAEISQTNCYFGSGKLTVKLTSPWNMPLSQKIKVEFTGKKTFRSLWVKTNSKGIATVDIPDSVVVGSYSIGLLMENGVGYVKSFKITDKTVKSKSGKVIINQAKAKIKYPKTAKKSSGIKITLKYKNGGNPIKKTKFTVKISNGKKTITQKLTTNGKGILKIDAKKLKKGIHKGSIILKNKNLNVNNKFKVKIK